MGDKSKDFMCAVLISVDCFSSILRDDIIVELSIKRSLMMNGPFLSMLRSQQTLE